MGTVRMGPPERLVEALRDAHRITTFVETGTYRGETARWAAGRFERVVTLEASRTWWERSTEALRPFSNVRVVFGDSRSQLAGVVAGLEAPAIFWLDAHWSGGETFGAEDECPLLAELEVVLGAAPDHLVLVDDARLFLAPPPRPHRAEAWPDLRQVLDAVARRRDRYLAVFEDVIAIVPPGARAVVAGYCQDQAAAAAGRRRGLAGRLRRSGALVIEALRTLVGG